MPRPFFLFLLIMSPAALSFLPGCVALVPYQDAIASIPQDRFIEVDGLPVHVEDEGSGPPVVLLHGFAASTYSYHKLAPRLAEDFRVVAIDLYGFGYTQRPEAEDHYTPEGQIRMVRQVLDDLGIETCAVVGHSYGATLAMHLAANQPERVDRLVLISPPTELEPPPLMLRTAPGRLVGYGLVRSLLSNPGSFRRLLGNAYYQKDVLTPEVAENYRERMRIEGLPDAMRGFTKGLEQAEAYDIDPAGIAIPTLVVTGRHDRIVDPDACRQLAETLPQGDWLLLDSSGHSAPEEEPENLAAAIRTHLTADQPSRE